MNTNETTSHRALTVVAILYVVAYVAFDMLTFALGVWLVS